MHTHTDVAFWVASGEFEKSGLVGTYFAGVTLT